MLTGALVYEVPTGLVQVTLLKTSELVGQNIRKANFRSRFNAAVLAVKRHSGREPGRLGDVVLQPGDILILSAPPDFGSDKEVFKYAADHVRQC